MAERGDLDLTGAKQNTGVWLVKVLSARLPFALLLVLYVVSSFSESRRSHAGRSPFKVLHGHFLRASRVLRGRTHCCARLQTRQLGTHSVLQPIRSPNLPGTGLHSPRPGFPGARSRCPRFARCILPQTEEFLRLLLVKLVIIVNL